MKKSEIFILLFCFIMNIKTLNAQWIQANDLNVYPVSAFAVSGNNIYAGTERNGVFLSTDNGANWVQITSRLTYRLNTIIAYGGYIFAGTQGGGVSRFSDSSSIWEKVNSGLTDTTAIIHTFAVNNEGLFAGAFNGLFLSTNKGATWNPVDLGTNPTPVVLSIAVQGTNLYVGTNRYDYIGGGVFHSTDNGKTWPYHNNTGPSASIHKLIVSGSNVLAGTFENGVFISTDSCKNWIPVNTGLISEHINALYTYSNTLLIGTYEGNNIYLSNNNASAWLEYNLGLTSDIYFYDFIAAGDNILAGTSQGVWIRSINDTVTSVKESKIKNKKMFWLTQNYPNPFNPTTKIKYNILKAGHVILKIYDFVGREVTTLIDKEQSAGSYETEFNGKNLSSGIYFYKLQAESYTKVRKMILIK